MVDINLHQAAENDLRINKGDSVFKSGFFVSILLLAVVFGFYLAVLGYKGILLNKKNNLTMERSKQLASFDISEINKVVDFQYRVDNINFNISHKRKPEDILNIAEKFIVKGSYLDSYSYGSADDKIQMEVVLNSFRLGANQMLSLKKSDLFSDVKVVDSGRNQDEQAVFKLEASFKN